jgi:uncharacterized membrane protein YkoI
MSRARAFSVLFIVSVLAPSLAIAQGAPASPIKVSENKPGLLKRAKVSPDSATKLAAAAVPNGRVTSGEIEEEKGKLIYSFDIKVPGKRGIEEIHIDPATGGVVGREHENESEKPATPKPRAAKP